MKKFTKEEFIKKAKLIHGNKFSYDKVEYNGMDTKIIVTCQKHGDFQTTPYSHINSLTGNCPKCNKEFSSSRYSMGKDEFIRKSIKVHGNKYDYSKVDYINNRTKVCIICPEHGEFWQLPSNHLKGSSCPKCAKNYKLTTETFKEKANEIHSKKYNYDKVNYINRESLITIICPIHGEFLQKAGIHLMGSGCPKCGNDSISKSRTKDLNEYINQAKLVHGSKYDYSKTEWKGFNIPIRIICPEHGEFWQLPSNHLKGNGCSYCSGHKVSYNNFIERANNIHNNKYDYSKVSFSGVLDKITIICPEHGEFIQSVASHLCGSGCPKCNSSRAANFVLSKLNEFNIISESEKTFDWLIFEGKQRLDFYLQNLNIAIEVQGIQHFYSCDYFGGEEEFKKILLKDENKYKLCAEHGIKVLYYVHDNFEIPQEFLDKHEYIRDIDELLKQIENVQNTRLSGTENNSSTD